MRDIRGDLQDRAGFLEEQINAAQSQFEKRMELFTREHESKIADLQAELEAVSMLMEREYRRIMSAPDVEEERRQAAPQAAPEQHRPAVAAEIYEEADYPEEEPEALPEEEPYADAAVAEAAPTHRAPEPQYAPRPAPRADEEYRRPVAAEVRPRRPIAVEPAAAERRPAAAPVYDRPAARAPEPRQDEPRQEAPRQDAPRQDAPRQEQPRRAEASGRYEPVQRDLGPSPAQRQPLADFLIRKLGEVGNMSLDDLCGVAIQEGYFAEGDNPDRTVHMTLMNVVKAGFIRQMPNGTFAPASVMDTIRLRRAI
ncbi:hypothetical protein AUC68_11705 [Methyloceanibacter methanicus]|uniref:Uncharacterized protein n=1 Tax=Methyloceanibacter methanicus TaxID=1774968 RepID=A0A1E3W5F1_9HYPH|nr:hypothetical protein [Methyloceanibacter methanicus]ODS01049.1 hypothetical protein AUC68_11705 [Methyloceanibacter methanicus]